MRRRQVEPVVQEVGGIPVELLAGMCIEVWADREPPSWRYPDEEWKPWTSAWRNYNAARRKYLTDRGINPHDHQATPEQLRSGGLRHPWSFEYLTVNNPDYLAAKLERLGLPPDWRPTRTIVEPHGHTDTKREP